MKFYTEEMDDFIKEKYNNYDIDEFVKMFNRCFEQNRTKLAIISKAKNLGIKRIGDFKDSSDKYKKININDIKKRTIDKEEINGYKLVKFYSNCALFEKKTKTGEIIKTTYTYWELNKII